MPPKGSKRKSANNDSEPAHKLAKADCKSKKDVVSTEKAEEPFPTPSHKIDMFFDLNFSAKSKAAIYLDYSCMLNQTDIINNVNKFYVIQIAKAKGSYHLFTRWGRIGEDGQNKTEIFQDSDSAVKSFISKFQAKTGNKWENRANFVQKPKKYTLGVFDESDNDDLVDSAPSYPSSTAKCSLDFRTQMMIELIFNSKMMTRQIDNTEIDTLEVPLTRLNKGDIEKGFKILLDLEEAIKNKQVSKGAQLSVQFFAMFPHIHLDRSAQRIKTIEDLKQKRKNLIRLEKIELGWSLQNVESNPAEVHPADVNYRALKCDMKWLHPESERYKLLQNYVKAARDFKEHFLELADIWELDRHGERERFAVNGSLECRKLLWFGPNVGEVASVLNSGLRVSPHFEGRVGKGVYLSAEFGESAKYANGYDALFHGSEYTAFLFLCEVALGKMKDLDHEGRALQAAPQGFDSVVARGNWEPDPKKEAKIELDGKVVSVPLGQPSKSKKWRASPFKRSKYAVYNEHQVRLRYLLKFYTADSLEET